MGIIGYGTFSATIFLHFCISYTFLAQRRV